MILLLIHTCPTFANDKVSARKKNKVTFLMLYDNTHELDKDLK